MPSNVTILAVRVAPWAAVMMAIAGHRVGVTAIGIFGVTRQKRQGFSPRRCHALKRRVVVPPGIAPLESVLPLAH